MNSRLVVFVSLMVMLCYLASAATIHGSVYDPSLNLLNNVELEINTTPYQNAVSKNGLYFFYVPLGKYEIKVEKFYNKTLIYRKKQAISVDRDGEFNIDIVAEQVPGTIAPPPEKEAKTGILEFFVSKFGYLFYVAVIFLLVVIVGLIISLFVFFRNRPEPKKSIIMEIPELLQRVTTSYSLGTSTEKVKDEQKEEVEKEEEEGVKKEQEAEKQVSDPNDLDNILKIIREEGGRATQKDIRRKTPLSEAKVSLMISELEAKGKIEKIKKGRGNIVVIKNP
jgi:uncharacterized membrane protein